MSNPDVAKEIIKLIGGKGNISKLTHCMTRLRFELQDTSQVDREALKAMPEVLGVMDNRITTMVVIGQAVNEVYLEIKRQLDSMPNETPQTVTANASDNKKAKNTWFDNFLATISAIFTPYIPVLATSGIIKGIVDVLVKMDILSATSDTYLILAATGNALIYFFPILLAFTAAQRFGSNPYIAAVIGAALMEPHITGIAVTGNTINFLGINFTAMSFPNTVIPILLAIWAYSYLDRWLKKVLHKSLHFILVPFLSLLIMVPSTLMVFGPVGSFVADGIASGYQVLLNLNPIVFNAIFGAFFIYVIMLGVHWVILPLQLSYLAKHGMEYTLGSGGFGNYALLGVCLAVMAISKNKEEKTIAGSAAFVNFLSGVTEPGLYGVAMRNKKYFFAISLGGLVGGIIYGATNSYITNFAFSGLLGIPAFLSSPTAVTYFISVGAAIAVAFVVTFALIKKS